MFGDRGVSHLRAPGREAQPFQHRTRTNTGPTRPPHRAVILLNREVRQVGKRLQPETSEILEAVRTQRRTREIM
jgi:hypothetical protein